MDVQTEDRSATPNKKWTDSNLETQGYDLAELRSQRGRSIGLRFTTGTCLALVVTALLLQSAPMLLVLSATAAIAGFALRHPFDAIWNHVVRHPLGADSLPTNPARRRHSFKMASVWLLAVALLLASGNAIAADVLGATLVGACTLATTSNLCLLSVMLKGFQGVRQTLPHTER